MKNTSKISDEQIQNEVSQILPSADQLRLVALGRTSQLSAAKAKCLKREEQIATLRFGAGSSQALQYKQRGEIEQQFSVQNRVQIQLGKTEIPKRDDNALVIFGRAVDSKRLGHPELTVSAINARGKASAFTCTDENGGFKLNVPVTDDGIATLLVSDSKKAILFRGTEVFQANGGKVFYRELVLAEDAPCPPAPPPVTIPETVLVPELVGLSQAEAERKLKATGLATQVETQESENDQAGKVVAQSPAANTSVKVNSAVTITIGILRSKVEVPKLIGLAFGQAESVLKNSRLEIGSVKPPRPPRDALVIGQTPDEGSSVDAGSVVDIEVQAEPEVPDVKKVPVPDVVGQKIEDGQTILKKAKLALGEVKTQFVSKDKAGIILRQSPKAGSSVLPKSKVNLTIGTVKEKRRPLLRGFERIIAKIARDAAFKNITASESKLRNLANLQGIKTLADAQKLLEKADREIRDIFRLKNLREAKVFKGILKKALKE